MKLSDITRPTSIRAIREQGGDEGRDSVSSLGNVCDLFETHGRGTYPSGKSSSDHRVNASCLHLSGIPKALWLT